MSQPMVIGTLFLSAMACTSAALIAPSDGGAEAAQDSGVPSDASVDVSPDVYSGDATPFCGPLCSAPIFPDPACNSLGTKWRCDCDLDAGGPTPPSGCRASTVLAGPGRVDFCCGPPYP